MADTPLTRETTGGFRAVLEFNLGPNDARTPVWTAKYSTLGEVLDIVRAFGDVPKVSTSITSTRVMRDTEPAPGFERWKMLDHSDWCDL